MLRRATADTSEIKKCISNTNICFAIKDFFYVTALKKSCMAGRNLDIWYILISHVFVVALLRIAVVLLSNVEE